MHFSLQINVKERSRYVYLQGGPSVTEFFNYEYMTHHVCVMSFFLHIWNVKTMPLVNMDSLTTKQRILVAQTYYENSKLRLVIARKTFGLKLWPLIPFYWRELSKISTFGTRPVEWAEVGTWMKKNFIFYKLFRFFLIKSMLFSIQKLGNRWPTLYCGNSIWATNLKMGRTKSIE